MSNEYNSRFSPTNTLSQQRKEQEQKQWRKCENKYSNQKNKDFIQFIRIVRVHCTESEDITSVSLSIYFVLKSTE